MRHSRAIGALISTVVALGALVAPVAANGDGITFEAVVQPDGGCAVNIRKDGETFKSLSDGIGVDGFVCGIGELPAGGASIESVVRLGDGLVYFQWGRHVWVWGTGGGGGGGPTSGWSYAGYYGKTWVTDGTEEGTVERPCICPHGWLVGKTILYTRCNEHEWEWLMAGGRSGDLYVHAPDIAPWAVVGDTLYYTNKDRLGRELWSTRGPSFGRLRDIRPGPKGSGIKDFRVRWGRLYFTANDGDGVARWVTDGTREGTRRVKR